VKSARLRPRVICKHRRRGCARSARLSLGVTERSRIAVRVVRLRRANRVVRRLTLGLRKRPALRIRARGLKRGRYRVLVVATSATGRKAAPRAFTLRVR
jgi:hypothetical protein